MTTNTTIHSQYTKSILTAAGHQRIGTRILGHLHRKGTREPLIKDLPSTIKEAAHQIVVTVVVKAHTHLELHTTCSTVVKTTIAQKIAPYSLSLKEKWNNNPTSLRSKWHPEKSSTLCNGLSTTSNIIYLTLHFSHASLPK
jgi:hypothetical protein